MLSAIEWGALLVAALLALLLVRGQEKREEHMHWELVNSRFVNNHVLLQVGFASAQPQWWILDTGSTHHLMDSTYAARFDRKLIGHIEDVNQPGAGFSAQQFEQGYLLCGGEQCERGARLPIAMDNVGVLDLQHLAQSLGMPLGGILGCDLFYNHVISIDFPRQQVWMRINGPFSLPPPPSHHQPAVLDAEHGTHHLLVVPMQINALPAGPWSLDTGSNVSIISYEFAQRQALKGGAPTQAQLVNRTINIAPLQAQCTLGSATQQCTIYVPDQQFAQAIQGLDGNLGLDILTPHRVTIDYRSKYVILD